MLLFDLKTGQPATILIDDANLTDIRTGIAGALASKELASEGIDDALIIGTGVQARYQARYICQNMKIKNLQEYMEKHLQKIDPGHLIHPLTQDLH